PLLTTLRACLEIRFGVPPLGGSRWKPPKGVTPNPVLRISKAFPKHALKAAAPSRNWPPLATKLLSPAWAFTCFAPQMVLKHMNNLIRNRSLIGCAVILFIGLLGRTGVFAAATGAGK